MNINSSSHIGTQIATAFAAITMAGILAAVAIAKPAHAVNWSSAPVKQAGYGMNCPARNVKTGQRWLSLVTVPTETTEQIDALSVAYGIAASAPLKCQLETGLTIAGKPGYRLTLTVSSRARRGAPAAFVKWIKEGTDDGEIIARDEYIVP